MKRWTMLGAVSVLAVVAAACGGGGGSDETGAGPDSSSGEQSGEVCTAERVGGSLTVAPLSLGSSLDPLHVGGGSSQTALEYVALYDSLLRYEESTGEFVGQVAESIEPNEDASVWTLHLRDDVTFGNGDPLDAEAVVASTERYLDPDGDSRMKSVAQFIADVEATDPLTVVFTLEQPWGFFPIHLTAGGGAVGALGMVVNTNVVEEQGEAFGEDATGAGAGPYEVARWSPPEEIVLEAKDDWWGGPVCIEQLTFTGLSSGEARLDGMRTGGVDMAIQYRDPVIAREAQAEWDNVTSVWPGGNMVEINAANEELSDVRTRRAMALAIDPTVVDQRAFGGEGIPTAGLVPPGSALLEETEGIGYDPDAASELVEELKGEGFDLSFELIVGDQAANVEGALAVEALLEAAGFTLQVTPMNTTDLITSVYSERNFELAIGGQVGSDVTLYASLFRFDSRNPANPYGFGAPSIDEALDELQAAQDPDELQTAIEGMQEQWNEHVPAVVLGADEATWLWRDGIQGLKFTRGVTPFFDTMFLED